MILISHRGNTDGIVKNIENSPQYVQIALDKGFDVEIDVWYVDSTFYLGHDAPMYEVNEIYLENEKFWCHAKNEEAFFKMLENPRIHCFWHQTDDYTITSKGYFWVYPGKELIDNSIVVFPEKIKGCLDTSKEIHGICSDYISMYNE